MVYIYTMKLVTMKVPQDALTNFRIATAMLPNGKQYEVVMEASEDVLKKISNKIKKGKPKP